MSKRMGGWMGGAVDAEWLWEDASNIYEEQKTKKNEQKNVLAWKTEETKNEEEKVYERMLWENAKRVLGIRKCRSSPKV